MRSITQNWSRRAFYLKCDLANFFVSIDKQILLDLLLAKISEPFWRALTERVLMHDPRDDFEYHDCLYVFSNRYATHYTPAGFKTEWSKLMSKALELKKIGRRFTFHDLRAYYVTRHKAERGALPDLHANPATTARVYDRTKIVRRRGM